MKLEFIPIDYSVFDFNSKNYVKIVGRGLDGKRVCVIDDYEPNFWVVIKKNVSEDKIKKIMGKIGKIVIKGNSRKTRVLKIGLHEKNFLGEKRKAIRVFITNHKDAHDVADKIGFDEVEKRREYDIPLVSKYIMEKKVEPLCWYEIEGEEISHSDDFGGIGKVLDVDFCLKIESIKKIERQKKFMPRILCYDIESDDFELGKGNILMISVYGLGGKAKKVFTWKNCANKQNFVECFKDEGEMLEAFVKYVKEQDPDLLVGYFSDGFDLPYLRARAEKNEVKLSLGLDGSHPVFARGRIPSGKIFGITHIDLFRFIKTVYSQYLKSETLSLNEVSSELLGERKHDFDFSKIGKMKDSDWKDFFGYNLQDSILTYKLAEKLWPDMVEFSKIIQRPLFNITRDSMSAHVENYLLHNLDRFNEISEKRPIHSEIGRRRRMGKYEGAFVFEPSPGLYENIAMFDFTSFWPSIIVSYNLSKTSFLEKKQKNSLEVNLGENKVYFSKQKGFFPEILEGIIEKRKKYKKEWQKNKNPISKARSNAYKLLANAAYGYQGFFGARYYCQEASAATTAISREFIKKTIEKIEENGHKIIYSDTDSIAFLLGDKTKKQTLEFLKELNSSLPGIMELELEDFYKRGLFVSKRSGSSGAKKKYALLDEKGKLKIRGFETVRRDWCKLARNLQNKVLESVLENGNGEKALEIVKKVVKDLKKRKIDKKELIIRTQLKKPIKEYIARGPHVIAAEKMEQKGIRVSQGMLIEFYIAKAKGQGKKLVRDKVKLPDEKDDYDIEYYLNNQILASVENILEVFGINMKEVVDGERQERLF